MVDVDELSRDSKERLANLQKNQKNFGNDISNVARSLEGMVMEIKNNKLEEEGGILQSRLTEKVIDPLIQLTSESLPLLSINLDEVRRINDKKSRGNKFNDINNSQLYVIQALKEILDNGSQALIMLPEIGLTAQFEKKFEEFFGFKPSIWHSGVSKKNKQIAWANIVNGSEKVVIGARSSLFLPFKKV